MARGSIIDRFLGLPPGQRAAVRTDEDPAAPMRDGVVLREDRYVADGHDDTPVLLMRTPYGRKHLCRRL